MAKVSFKTRDVARPPEDEPWTWHSYSLLRSDAWRHRSINCARLLDFLELEHLRHGGAENGNLVAPYDQLVKWGLGRRLIRRAIEEAERRGLLIADRGFRTLADGKVEPTRFRLTYLHSTIRDLKTAVVTKHAPTNEWRRYKEPLTERNDEERAALAARFDRQKVVSETSKDEPSQCTIVNLGTDTNPRDPANNLVHEDGLKPNARSYTAFYISGRSGDSADLQSDVIELSKMKKGRSKGARRRGGPARDGDPMAVGKKIATALRL